LSQGRILQQLPAGATRLRKALAKISVWPRRLFRTAISYGENGSEYHRQKDHTL
jgi:hypothetical protein